MAAHICEFCKNEFKTVSSLNFHKKKAKKCLEQRSEFTGYTCDDCKGVYATKMTLDRHKKSDSCKRKQLVPSKIVVEMTVNEYKQYQDYLKSGKFVSVDTIDTLDFTSLAGPFHKKQINDLGTFLRPLLHRKIIVTGNTIKYKNIESSVIEVDIYKGFISILRPIGKTLIDIEPLEETYDSYNIIRYICDEENFEFALNHADKLSGISQRRVVNAKLFIDNIIKKLGLP